MGPFQAEVELSVIDVEAAWNTVSSTEGQSYWSDPAAALTDGGAKDRSYATFEPGRWRADGRLQILDAPGGNLFSEGYVSEAISDATGRFLTVPVLVLNLKEPASVPALTFRFDSAAGEWCSKLTVTARNGQQELMRKTVCPDAVEYEMTGRIDRFDQLEIRFEQTNRPHRRVRLTRFLFGLRLLFDGSDLAETTHTMETDPIDRRLPIGTFEFSAVNINGLTNNENGRYDPEKPNGIWRYFEQRSPIMVQYTQHIQKRNMWERIPGGRFYLTAQPETEGLYAKFSATDALGILDKTYYKGVWDGKPHTLWELAEAVLEDATIPRRHKETVPWKLWDGLKNITTTAPMPVKQHRECLQLIAHAAGCVLYVDREGFIRIEPEEILQRQVGIGLFDMLEEAPAVEKNPTLMQVDCPVTVYLPQEKESQLHRGTYHVAQRLALHLSWNAAAQITVQCTGAAIAEKTLYAAAGDFVLEGNGTAELLITGKKLETSKQNVTAFVVQPDKNGAVEQLENPLVTDSERALAVAQWVRDYLLRRSTYTCTTRGNPEIDPLDRIFLNTQWMENVPAQVVKNRLICSGGGLQSELVLKKQQECPVMTETEGRW